MNHQVNKINIIFVGQHIESQIVFNNALSNLKLNLSMKSFFKLNKAIQYLDECQLHKPDMIFLETGTNQNCLESIRQIKALHQYRNVSIVLYDSGLQSLDNEEALAGGTNVYIHRSRDYDDLKKILGHVIRVDHDFRLGNRNRDAYWVSL